MGSSQKRIRSIMKRVLLLCLHRPDRSPSQRYRIEQYLPYLKQNGFEIDYSYLLDADMDKIFYKPGHYFGKMQIVLSSTLKRLAELLRIKKYDLIFVQREAYMLGTPFFERAMAAKVPMIFDFDDSIWIQQVSEGNKKLSFLKDASKTAKIIEKSALVFAGNQYLADYAKQYNKNVVIIPTTIDTDVYVPVEHTLNEKICIGWSGSFSTIEHFSTAIPALKRIKERFGDAVYFKIIGDPTYYCQELDTKGIAWKAATETQDLSEMQIGIMPLPDTEWAKGKCGLKGLQYMAMGIATLMSPVGVNSEIIQPGINGYLPNSEDEWVDTISALIEDYQLRTRIGAAGRRTVVEKYSSNAWKEQYLHHFNELTN